MKILLSDKLCPSGIVIGPDTSIFSRQIDALSAKITDFVCVPEDLLADLNSTKYCRAGHSSRAPPGHFVDQETAAAAGKQAPALLSCWFLFRRVVVCRICISIVNAAVITATTAPHLNVVCATPALYLSFTHPRP
jgi:hypothetical protein